MPPSQGLYRSDFEKDACGVAFVAALNGRASHSIIADALTALRNLEHRGASGAEPDSGDGAGILLSIPDAYFRAVANFPLPVAGMYATGIAFIPKGSEPSVAQMIERVIAEEGMALLGWHEVTTNSQGLGATAKSVMPDFKQIFVAGENGEEGIALDRLAFMARKRIEHELKVYFPSLSARTIVYKGMLTTGQLESFFPELSDSRMESPLALVHSRFSTNTFPSWPLAHPYRFIAHNGEINTVKGNRNWMRAREALLASDILPGDIKRIFPICADGGSDSASFDEVLELLHLGGRSLPHSVLMMIPEAWENNLSMSQKQRDFYAFHGALMEPWDGPACVTFTDGTQIGAVLDRNGLRPARYWITKDRVVLASEVGVLDIAPEEVVSKGRVQPGKMFLVDTKAGRIVPDEEIKESLATAAPYSEWLHAGLIRLEDLPAREHIVYPHASVQRRQRAFGYTEEEIRILVAPMAKTGGEPLGSMGTDTPIAVLSKRPRLLFDYFSQIFAQVTNPPLDAIREELVTSLSGTIGPEHNLMQPSAASCRQIVLPFPVIDNDELAKIVHVNADGDLPGFETHRVRGLFPIAGGGSALRHRIEEIRSEVSTAIAQGARIVILSDRDGDADHAPIPSLLLTSAVHHHLIREKTRTKVGLVVEAGDVREVHHVALLIGFGAAAVNPYLAMESAEDLVHQGKLPGVTPEKAVRNLIKALGKGVLKVMSKMGISTVASYTGAQVFEAIGLDEEIVSEYFAGTVSRLGGVNLDIIADEAIARHHIAYPTDGGVPNTVRLPVGGEYQWRRDGEPHLFDPDTVFLLQHATRTRRYEIFKRYTTRIDEQSERLMTLRGLFAFKPRTPISIDDVESVADIVKRFSTGAMSYGSISQEAHETLAIVYSIEDLAQLIHDLKNSNPDARIHVKLVAEVGVGTVAAGVSKAHADVVLISGHDGGTGASPLTSLKHAGAPWELGLAEAQQTLLLNNLRDRIVVQADGQMKTGRDVVIAALLGAEEFGFATAPLVVSGCVMMRVCHLDTCPVGVATQNPELRAKFSGRPEFVETFFEYIAEEVRELLASLGFRTLAEAVGQVEVLETTAAVNHWKARGLDLSPLLYLPPLPSGTSRLNTQAQDHGLEKALDQKIIQLAQATLRDGTPINISLPVRNVNRTVGTMLGSAVTKRFGGQGLPVDTILLSLHGSAGQSLGAFLPHGVTIRLFGDSNDYVGKGLSGGKIVVRPDEKATFDSSENIIAGNVIGYGATSGEIFLRGRVGERFCVRNSGAIAVVEGVSDHACEYMTGGTVVVLGSTGRNFAAGMSGGRAFVLDLDETKVNVEMVDLLPVPLDQVPLLKSLIEKHLAETSSPRAQELLADFQPGRFTMVMPRDYARVLAAMARAEAEGRSVEEAVMEASRG
ncbi:MAG: hypothetical protein EBV30_01815 [Actinobacteria bacterium]|nr:hypothetical protein [Actinomycetota bacterium]